MTDTNDRLKNEPGQQKHRDYIGAKEIHDHEFLGHVDKNLLVNRVPKTIPNPFPIEPVNGRIVVLPIPTVKIQKIGSIHLHPDAQIEQDYDLDVRGVIIKLPADDSLVRLKDQIKVGDTVCLALGVKPIVVVKGYTYLLIGEFDILGIQRADTIPTEEESKEIFAAKDPKPKPSNITVAKN